MEASATTQISRLQKMGLEELRAEYEKVFGKPSKSRNRKQLFSQIAKQMQAERAGQTTETAAKPTLTVKFERQKKTRKPAQKKATGRAKKSATGKKAKPQTKGKKGGTKRRFRDPGQRDPRLPKPGTDLVREWHGKKYVVRVLESGFEYDSKPFRSLSAVAKHICGQIVNGFAWFNLTGTGSKKA
jgi:hypothetical protein